MGGVNSGRRRTVHRGAVEQYPSIDIRILRRAGLLQLGKCTYDTLCWRSQAPEALSARIFVDLSDTSDASIRIVASDNGGTIKQRAVIECVACTFGGFRTYFLCPITGVRCEQLFLVDGLFASRKAHRLTYASQTEDHLSRARRKVRKLHRQVDGDARYTRPRGPRRWRTLQRLRIAEREARVLYIDRLRALVGDIQ
jgi:hypothetical protein